MTFGMIFRALRLWEGDATTGGPNRKQLRDNIRATRRRNDGRRKEM